MRRVRPCPSSAWSTATDKTSCTTLRCKRSEPSINQRLNGRWFGFLYPEAVDRVEVPRPIHDELLPLREIPVPPLRQTRCGTPLARVYPVKDLDQHVRRHQRIGVADEAGEEQRSEVNAVHDPPVDRIPLVLGVVVVGLDELIGQQPGLIHEPLEPSLEGGRIVARGCRPVLGTITLRSIHRLASLTPA